MCVCVYMYVRTYMCASVYIRDCGRNLYRDGGVKTLPVHEAWELHIILRSKLG